MEQLQEIDEILSLINDGQWHPLDEIIKKARLPKPQTDKILQFLANHNFIALDNDRKKAKVTPSLTKFLEENQTG